mmetsp:Transcript_63979/g.175708  ORF Transcript_63979/g.175708 Transcript_63979/m.175708 type:complete len:208 (+) Transcript_63979:473-1096(+)
MCTATPSTAAPKATEEERGGKVESQPRSPATLAGGDASTASAASATKTRTPRPSGCQAIAKVAVLPPAMNTVATAPEGARRSTRAPTRCAARPPRTPPRSAQPRSAPRRDSPPQQVRRGRSRPSRRGGAVQLVVVTRRSLAECPRRWTRAAAALASSRRVAAVAAPATPLQALARAARTRGRAPPASARSWRWFRDAAARTRSRSAP